MGRLNHKRELKNRRRERTRTRVRGTSDRPRMSISISNRSVSAQIIDDSNGKTLAHSTSKVGKSLTDQAAAVGADIAKKGKAAKIKKVVLDKGDRRYHRRLDALAEAARKEGLEF